MARPLRFESLGSYWELDEELKRYRRCPKGEGPRERPEWSDERAGILQDFVWHDYTQWWVEEHPDCRLFMVASNGMKLQAPISSDVYISLKELLNHADH